MCVCGCMDVFAKGKLIGNVSRLAVYDDITFIYIYIYIYIYYLNTDTADAAISHPQLGK